MTTQAPAATLKRDKHKSQIMDLIDLVTLHGSDIKTDRDISANRHDQKVMFCSTYQFAAVDYLWTAC